MVTKTISSEDLNSSTLPLYSPTLRHFRQKRVWLMDDSRKTAKFLTRSTEARQRPFTHRPAGSRCCHRHVNGWCGRRLRLTVISSSPTTEATFSVSPPRCCWHTFARTSCYHSVVRTEAALYWQRATGWRSILDLSCLRETHQWKLQ